MARPRRTYAENERAENLASYFDARGGTYHSYVTMLGESFATRINLLSHLLNDAHHLTTGRYKESILANLIADFIPGRYSVGTGFVLFPVEGYSVEGDGDDAEAILEITKHVPSRQLDILIYESHTYPVLFRDHDLVVVRPEAVRCVIEVKGFLDHQETDDFVALFVDFGTKWVKCRRCYDAIGAKLPANPTLLAMAWAVKPDRRGRPSTDGMRLRERIVAGYKEAT
jgi:hypothetical protein